MHFITISSLVTECPFFSIAMQILFEEVRLHWVLIASKDGEIYMYDSCLSTSPTLSIVIQLLELYGPAVEHNTLLLCLQSTQQQTGKVDCGLFAVAVAVEVAVGGCVENSLMQSSMRSHLVKCLEQGKLTPFPTTARPRRRSNQQFLSVPVYCGVLSVQETGLVGRDDPV